MKTVLLIVLVVFCFPVRGPARARAQTSCLEIPPGSVVVECDSSGSNNFRYTFSVTNLFGGAIHNVYLLGGWPATFTPNHFSLVGSPLQTGGTAGSFTTVVSGVAPDSVVCFRISIHDSLLQQCCSIENCISTPCSTVVVGVPELPPYDLADPYLEPNWPNPFNPSTTIRFWLPEAGRVALRIYDTSGREIRTLVNRFTGNGYHTLRWDGRDMQGRAVASGVYFSRLEFGASVQSRKMVLMK